MNVLFYLAIAGAIGVIVYRLIMVTSEITHKKRKVNKYDSLATILIGAVFLIMSIAPTRTIRSAVIKLFAALIVLYYLPDLFFPVVKGECHEENR